MMTMMMQWKHCMPSLQRLEDRSATPHVHRSVFGRFIGGVSGLVLVAIGFFGMLKKIFSKTWLHFSSVLLPPSQYIKTQKMSYSVLDFNILGRREQQRAVMLFKMFTLETLEERESLQNSSHGVILHGLIKVTTRLQSASLAVSMQFSSAFSTATARDECSTHQYIWVPKSVWSQSSKHHLQKCREGTLSSCDLFVLLSGAIIQRGQFNSASGARNRRAIWLQIQLLSPSRVH